MSQASPLVTVQIATNTANAEPLDELMASAFARGLTTVMSGDLQVELIGSPECNIGGHRIAAPVTYHDGLIAGSCERCGARFEMPWLAGGTAAAKVMSLAETILAVLDTGNDVPDHVINDFVSALAQARADSELLDDALDLGDTVGKVLARQLLE